MLKKAQLFIAYHVQSIINSFNLLCKQPFATLLTLIVIAIALMLPTIFIILSKNFNKLTEDWHNNECISLYVNNKLSSADQTALLQNIKKIVGVAEVKIKTATEALIELQKQDGMHNIMHYLNENPLPIVIEVTPNAKLRSVAQIENLFNILQNLPHIEQAKLDLNLIIKLNSLLNFIKQAINMLILALAIAVILIISNTLRLAVQNCSDEISVLKLIGATNNFIARVFVYAGVWYGLLGGIIAILFVNIFILTVSYKLQKVIDIYNINYVTQGLTVKQAYQLVLAAISLGWLGAIFSVKKQLILIESV